MSTKSLLLLYKALVTPQIQFAAPVWQNSSSVDVLNKIHRKGLALCLGVVATAASNALEVEASVFPLELRREHFLSGREVKSCPKTVVRQSNSCGMNGEMIIEVRKDTCPLLDWLIYSYKIWRQKFWNKYYKH